MENQYTVEVIKVQNGFVVRTEGRGEDIVWIASDTLGVANLLDDAFGAAKDAFEPEDADDEL